MSKFWSYDLVYGSGDDFPHVYSLFNLPLMFRYAKYLNGKKNCGENLELMQMKMSGISTYAITSGLLFWSL